MADVSVDVLVVNQPTWGVDAAAAAIPQALLDLAAKDAAAIGISQDQDELMEVSDRFCALVVGDGSWNFRTIRAASRSKRSFSKQPPRG